MRVTYGTDSIGIQLDGYDRTVVEAIKKIPGRQWDKDSMTWYVPVTEREKVERLRDRFDNLQGKIWLYLISFPGKPLQFEPMYPPVQTYLGKEHVTILGWDGDKISRDYLGERIKQGRFGTPLAFAYREAEKPGGLPVGAVLEVRVSADLIRYFRKDENGWKDLGQRKRIVTLSGEWKQRKLVFESMSLLLLNEKF